MTSFFLIAVTGGSGSGKSTLAKSLKQKLGDERVLLFSEDAYYQPREFHGAEAPSWNAAQMEENVDFDDPASKDMALMATQLAALKRGESILQPYYDFALHDRVAGNEVELSPKPIIVADGVHVLSNKAFFELFDLTVFVDTPADLRLARRIQRDVKERGREVDRVIAQYLKFVRPAHGLYTEPAKLNCDLVIQDEGPLAMAMGEPDKKAENRLVAPVLGYLQYEGVI